MRDGENLHFWLTRLVARLCLGALGATVSYGPVLNRFGRKLLNCSVAIIWLIGAICFSTDTRILRELEYFAIYHSNVRRLAYANAVQTGILS